jgi:hypothetical protein
VTLDHTLEGCAVNTEQTRGCLFVAARVCEHALDVAALDDCEREQIFTGFAFMRRARLLSCLKNRRVLRAAYAFGQIFGAHNAITERDGTHHSVFQFAYVAGP